MAFCCLRPVGSYLYFEGGRSTGNVVNSRAVIYSEDLSATESPDTPLDLCMTFVYFLNASGAATVRVHQVRTPDDRNPIWEHRGRNSPAASATENVWRLAKVPLRGQMDSDTGFIVRTFFKFPSFYHHFLPEYFLMNQFLSQFDSTTYVQILVLLNRIPVFSL